jgi:ParB-like chromosome segregation protein Spo0J
MIKDLYDQDYYLWIRKTIELLNKKKFGELDLTNLVEEIQDMGKSEKKSITSNLRILLMHLLKYKYQSDKQTNSWLFTIVEHRKRLQEAFKVSPSLRRYYEEVFLDCYQDARELASAETGLSMQIFSEVCPFTPEEALNSNYLP